MFKNIVVGVDGRDGGLDAIALAQALRPERITLVTAYPAAGAPGRGVIDHYFRMLREDALELLADRRAAMDVDAQLVACPDRSPARALQRQAAERDADLIVVGSAHHGPIARLLLGDVGRAVLHGAPCPVAVAPRGFHEQREQPRELRRVSVGLDESAEAKAALALAAELAAEHGAALTTHTAWDLTPLFAGSIAYTPDLDLVSGAERDHVTEAVDAALADFPTAERRIERGAASAVLEAASADADLLVVGSRGWGPALRIALGSTSDHLVHHAACPVIVVPRPAALTEDEDPSDGARASAAR